MQINSDCSTRSMWDPEVEMMGTEFLRHIQTTRLRSCLDYCYHNIRFYRRQLTALGFDGSQALDTVKLEDLPFTTKADISQHLPLDDYTGDCRVRRIHSSSGTKGPPLLMGYSKEDLVVWSDLVARVIVAAGTRSSDVLHISFGYALFTGGLGLHSGAERIGAAVIPAGTSNPLRQIEIMRMARSSVLVSTPSYALHLADIAEQNGIELRSLGIRLGLFGAEPWTEEMRGRIQASWGLQALDNYGLSEVFGPGVAGECQAQAGMHLQEDHFIAEVIDPKTLRPVPPAHFGELVLTTLTKQVRPLIRYRTGDITRFIETPCDCGRTHRRIHRIVGRTDDMISVYGINVYPSAVEAALYTVTECHNEYKIIVRKSGYKDRIRVEVETEERCLQEPLASALEERIHASLRTVVGIDMPVLLLPPYSIPHREGKVVRVEFED